MKHYFALVIMLLIFVIARPSHADTAINGFISQGYLKTDKNQYYGNTEDGSFQFNDMGIRFSTQVSNNLNMGIQFFARDLGNLGNDEIKIDWANGDYIFFNELGIRAGLLKIPYGLYNETRDADMMRVCILLPSGIYSEAWRDSLVTMKGGGLYGTIADHFSYQIQTGGIEIPLDGGLVNQFQGIVSGETQRFSTENFSVASLQVSDIVDGLRLGVGYYYWKFNLDVHLNNPDLSVYSEGDIHTWIASVEYIIHNFIFASEYSIFKYEAPLYIKGTDIEVFDPSTETEFYYFSISYQINRFFSTSVYYSANYADRHDRKGKEWAKKFPGLPPHSAYLRDTCVSFRFDINPSWIFKTEWHHNEGSGGLPYLINKDENGDVDLEKYWNLVAAKLMFVF